MGPWGGSWSLGITGRDTAMGIRLSLLPCPKARMPFLDGAFHVYFPSSHWPYSGHSPGHVWNHEDEREREQTGDLQHSLSPLTLRRFMGRIFMACGLGIHFFITFRAPAFVPSDFQRRSSEITEA